MLDCFCRNQSPNSRGLSWGFRLPRGIQGRWCIGAVFAIALGNALTAAEYRVGPGETYSTIQSAINVASGGDTIVVAAGTYSENLTISKSLTLVGPNASVAALPESGWVRGAEAVVGSLTNTGNRVTINGGANVIEVHISGFRFVGPTTGNAAGGIVIYKSRGSIANNHFDKLTKPGAGGGADIYTQSGPGPWTFSGNRHDSVGYSFGYGLSPLGTQNYSAINAWYLDDVTIHGNRIENYGFAGIQLESTKNSVITSNYIKDVGANGIQVANGASTSALIQGNTIDHASAKYEDYFASYNVPIAADYGWAGIRLWQVSTSSTNGTVVRNNLITNTPARVGAIGFVGSNANRQTVGAVDENSMDSSNSDGILHLKAAVQAVSISAEIATIRLWEGSSTVSSALARTNHTVGLNVVVSGLRAPLDGTHEILSVGTWDDGYGWFYKEISFAVPGASDLEETFVDVGAAASEQDTAAAIPAAGNWWGSPTGPNSAGASLNSAGASASTIPWIVSYSVGSATVGFIDGVGFWPTNVVTSDSDADSDGLTTGDELTIYLTDPNNPDTDADGLNDGAEVLTYFTSPLSSDTDGDTFDDSFEVAAGYNPLNMDDPIPFGSSLEESMAAYLQDYAANHILQLDLGMFRAPNAKSRTGHRTSLANRMFAASTSCLSGDYDSAIESVQSILAKTSSATVERNTWLVCPETYSELQEILGLLVYLRDSQG